MAVTNKYGSADSKHANIQLGGSGTGVAQRGTTASQRLYILNQPAGYTPATARGAWDATGSAVTRALTVSAIDKSRDVDVGGASNAVAETSTNTEYDVLVLRAVSAPLTAQTISGVFQLCTRVRENTAAADFCWHVHVWVTQGDSDTVRGTLVTDYRETTAQEWTTAATGRELLNACTISSVSASAGDRVVIEIGYVARNASATSYTGTVYYGANISELDCDSTSGTAAWVQFSTPLTFDLSNLGTRVTQGATDALLTQANAVGRITHGAVDALMRTNDPARLSQLVAEALTTDDATALRLSQLLVETMSPGTVPSRLTQIVTEHVDARATNEQRLSSLVTELMLPVRIPINMSQLIVEYADGASRDLRVSQQVVEWIGRTSTYCGNPPMTPAPLCGKRDVLPWIEWIVPMKEN